MAMDRKLRIFGWLWMACLLAGIVGCSESADIPEEEPIPWGPDNIWEVPSISFIFHVLDEDGQDLMNPATPGSYAGARITATFRDTVYTKDYPVDMEEGIDRDNHDGKFFATKMYGLFTGKDSYSGEYHINFSGLPQRNDYENEKIYFSWPDGSKDSITFSNKLTWENYHPVFTGSYYLNDKKVGDKMPMDIITIRKKALDESTLGTTWEPLPLKFYFFLVNEDGKDLLNPDTRDDVASNRITATFREKEYVLNDSVYADTDLPFKGLRKHQQLYNDLFYLTFGELDGMEAYEDEELVLDWGNGQKDVVTFTSKMVMEGGKPTFVRDYKLNGEVVDGERTFPIRKTSYPVFWLVKPLEF